MDERLKQRLVGAAVLASLAVIFVPMILDGTGSTAVAPVLTEIPPRPDDGFSSRIIPLGEPDTPMLAAKQRRDEARARLDPGTGPAATAAEAPAVVPAAPPARVSEAPVAPVASAWAVQLGSFSNERNALTLRERLRRKGYKAFTERSRREGATVTRVFVGPELDREEAADLLGRLLKDTRLKGMVVRYPG